MKLLVLLLSLFIGVQSQTKEELLKQISDMSNEYNYLNDMKYKMEVSIKKDQDDMKNIEEEIFATRNETENFENLINNVTNVLTSCQTTKSACLEEDKKTQIAEKRLDEVKQDEERHRNELKALEDGQKNHPAKLEALNRELNETQNNLKLLEPELQELRLKLNQCTEETKYCRVTYQSTGKEKTDGGGFINKIVTSTLDKVQQFKKGVANILRSKINFLKLKIPE